MARVNNKDIFPQNLLENDFLINKIIAKKQEENSQMLKKYPKIFISHAEADENFGDALYELLKSIGIKDEEIFYSSERITGVPVTHNFLEKIKNELRHPDTIVIIIHSPSYYKSPICLNEMGAAWILNRKIYSFLTKNFEFENLTGVITRYEICFKSGAKKSNEILEQIISDIRSKFQLSPIAKEKQEVFLNKFLSKISTL